MGIIHYSLKYAKEFEIETTWTMTNIYYTNITIGVRTMWKIFIQQLNEEGFKVSAPSSHYACPCNMDRTANAETLRCGKWKVSGAGKSNGGEIVTTVIEQQ